MTEQRQRHPEQLTKAVTHIRLLEVNPGKLAALDELAPVYLALCQQYVTLFCTDEQPDKFHALKAYAHISQIPTDPYNVPVSLAKTLLQYDQSIQLTPAQQATYNQAATMTNDNGWCCCQCWAWYVHSGLSKYLIATQHFSAAQVAAVINEEDCCSGA